VIGLQRRLILITSIRLVLDGLILLLLHLLLSVTSWPLWLDSLIYSLFTLLLILLSLVMVMNTTKKVSKAVNLLSRKITALSHGQRNIFFNHSRTYELQEIARAAEVLQYELLSKEKERRRWTQDITHDLRTPITAIKSQLQAVRDGIFFLDKDRYDLLFRELGIVEKMVQDFALLSRIESPEMILHQQWLLSRRVVSNLLSRFTAQALERNIQLQQNGVEFYFKADEGLLTRAVSNLIQNAFQHCSDGGTIEVTLYIRKNQILFSVKNPGTIPEEDLPLIFQRLYRGEKSRTTSGSGLGLTIAKSIAQLHRGDIQAKNSPDGYTIFEMVINMEF
jgi:two-component system sensor histidine kinase BaeS